MTIHRAECYVLSDCISDIFNVFFSPQALNLQRYLDVSGCLCEQHTKNKVKLCVSLQLIRAKRYSEPSGNTRCSCVGVFERSPACKRLSCWVPSALGEHLAHFRTLETPPARHQWHPADVHRFLRCWHQLRFFILGLTRLVLVFWDLKMRKSVISTAAKAVRIQTVTHLLQQPTVCRLQSRPSFLSVRSKSWWRRPAGFCTSQQLWRSRYRAWPAQQDHNSMKKKKCKWNQLRGLKYC